MSVEHQFNWRDGERLVVFRVGAAAEIEELLPKHGWDRWDLISTRRAAADAVPDLDERAASFHEVPDAPVPEAATAIVDSVKTDSLVAVGGGRTIDTAKAVAAVCGARVAAIPTTLSGAEMTGFHRLPAGREADAKGLVRPVLVIADPDQMTTLPDDHLRASALNALAHGAEALYTPFASPVTTLAALRGAELIASALDEERSERDRNALALGSLLCAYASDSALFALHHVICQTLVRVLEIPHAETNATMLPLTMDAMRDRAPEAMGAFAAALGARAGVIARRIEDLGGGPRHLSDLGADRDRLDAALDAILERGELGMTPDPPGRDEIRDLIERAW
jgi:maleylacetate reductase